MSDIEVSIPAAVAQRELRQFLRMAERMGLDVDSQCRWLHLSRNARQQWVNVVHGAPLPAFPALPVLLRRLAYLASRVDRRERACLEIRCPERLAA